MKCVCGWLGVVWEVRGEWIRGLGLAFTKPVGTGGVLHVCRCCGCVCGGGRKLVGRLR